jgi:hypothetical protein
MRIGRVGFMTRSRNLSGKPTVKQLNQEMKEMQNVINQLVNAITNDMARVNGIMYAMLKEDGRLKEHNCPKCNQVLFEPQLGLLPPTKNCPACGHDMEDKMQMSIDDWDNGKDSEE